jgi:hypothetical protein
MTHITLSVYFPIALMIFGGIWALFIFIFGKHKVGRGIFIALGLAAIGLILLLYILFV